MLHLMGKRLKRSPRAYWEGAGKRVIMIPNAAIQRCLIKNTPFDQVYITDMGYYPKAKAHYMERASGSPESILFYCANGKGWYETDIGRFKVSPNQFFILPSHSKHRYGSDPVDPWSIYWVMFAGTFSDNLLETMAMKHCFEPNTLAQSRKFLDLYEDTYSTLADGYTTHNLFFANMNLWLILMQCVQQRVPAKTDLKNTPVGKTISFMKRNIDRKLTINELAAIAAYSPPYLHQLFKAQTGYSPLGYFIHLKMQQACDYLVNTDLRIKEIAPLIGYADPYLFSKTFTKVMGKSPQKYRSTTRV